ncbi:MAG: phosphoribosylamine--glycine ligase [Magnetococcales bacterium]|nr:phosphoribosylamine--glycine ligase [Magnetococcales bacterium]
MGKRILLVGGGGREHALAWKIVQSPLLEKLYCAPGNAGIAQFAECVPIDGEDLPAIKQFALDKKIDLAVIGPEGPLVAGLSDLLREAGIDVFGPSKAAAAIEGSKSFMKRLFAQYAIPTASYQVFTEPEAARSYIRKQGAPIVVKTSGLAAGKGAIVCHTLEEALTAVQRVMVDREFGSAGDEVVVEEFLTGEELSFIAFVDGENVLPLAGSQDHKAVGEGDTGPNTGGMGAYSPAPILTPALHAQTINQVMIPTVRAMAAEGRPFKGVLYAGLMIDKGELKVLEFNARFGDPETQPLLMRMKSDIVPLMQASAAGSLAGVEIEWDDRTALCVVMAAGGYPGSYEKGIPIAGLEAAGALEDVAVFHAGTTLSPAGEVVTAGGRVLGVTALGDGVVAAQQRAYEAVDKIQWDKAYYRRDIGYRAVEREAK